jgi:hypothetical protein
MEEDSQCIHVHHGQQKQVTKPFNAQSYNEFMGGVDTSDAMLYSYLDERRRVKYWKKICFNIFSIMVLNSYITYKENIPAACKPMSKLDYTIKIVNSLSKEWLQERNGAAWTSGTKNEETESKFLRKLPAKKEKDCCVYSKGLKDGPVTRRRPRRVCVSGARRVFMAMLPTA